MQLHIRFSPAQGVFALPCEAVDHYLNDAPADALRLLLYLYRNGGEAESGALCAALRLDGPALSAALDFWAVRGLLAFAPAGTAERESAATRAPQPGAEEPGVQKPAEKRARKSPALEPHAHPTARDIAARAGQNEEIRFLLDAAPALLGRLLSPADCSILLFLYDNAGLPADVILMLLEYCVDTGHTNLRYLEKTALSWAEAGIDTHEKAEQRIRQLETLHSYEGQVRGVLGISGRALTPTEREHLARWQSEWQTPLDLVRAAFDICVKRTGRLSFSYMNTILKDWHEKGYKTAEQAKNERRGQPGRDPGKHATYDLGEYVDLSMKRLLEDK